MDIKARSIKNFYLLGTLVFAFSCSPSNVITTPKPTTSPSASVSSSVKPSVQPTPSSSITPIPSVTPSTNPLPIDTPTATPTPITQTGSTSDIKVLSTINGKVYDEVGNPLDNIKITVTSLEKDFAFSAETLTNSGGSYVFRNIPVGIRIEIKAFKSDKWTQRLQVYVAKSNLEGRPDANVIDFGDTIPIGTPEKANYLFLTDAPEVIDVTPERQTTIKHNGIKMKFTFSELVKKETFENYFVLRYLSSDVSTTTILGDGSEGTTKTDGPPTIAGKAQVIIDRTTQDKKFEWDTDSFNPNGKEVTFSLPESRGVITSNTIRTIYGVSLRENAGTVKLADADGNRALDAGEFFLSKTGSGNRAKNHVVYVDADKTSPSLDLVKLIKNSSNCIIRLTFSEPMNVEGFSSDEVIDLSFYKFFKNSTPITLQDPTVRVTSQDSIEILTSTDTFSLGDTIRVEVDPNLKDPARNFFSQGVTSGERDYIRELKYNP